MSKTLMPRSKAEHVIQAEAAACAQDTVIAEQPAGFVADDHVRMAARFAQAVRIEHFADAPVERAGARDCDILAREFGAAFTAQCERGRRLRMPALRYRIDQMANRFGGAGGDPQEEARRQSRRWPGI